MSVSSTTNKVTYTGNGAVDTYAYTFRITDDDHLLVTVRNTSDVETTLVKTTDYTVTGVGASGGGNVVLVNSAQAWLDGDGDLKSSYILTIRRVVPLTQETDIRNQGTYYPETHEDTFDKSVFIAQQQQDEIDRSVKLPETIDDSDFDPTLPSDLLDSADKVPLMNATGDGFADVADWPTADEIDNAQTYASNASTSATAAAASASAASTSASTASAAASSATAALNSAFFRDVVYITSADSPYTITSSHNGKLISCNTSGGAISVTMPQISTLTLPFNVAFALGTAGNTLTLNRSSTDTIGGATSKAISTAGVGCQLVADTDGSPDNYEVVDYGTVADGAISTAKLANEAVSLAKIAAAQQAAFCPAGAILAYSGTAAPTGWLLCDGTAVSRSTYADLYAVISTAYGSGDGSTTFNLPDLRWSFLRGRGANLSATGSGSASSDNGTFTAHGFSRSGIKVRLTSGTLSGLSSNTDYWTIYVDANTLAFGSSRANALAGTKVSLSGANSAVIGQYEDPDVASRVALQSGGNTGASVGSFQEDAMQGHEHTIPVVNSASDGADGIRTTSVAANSTRDSSSPTTDGTNGTPRTSVETRAKNITVNYIIKT